jgi:hippurate hydrolase
MAGEDFGRYGITPEKVPIFLFWLGTTDPEEYSVSLECGGTIHPLHSPYLAPDFKNSIKTGIKAMSYAVIHQLSK